MKQRIEMPERDYLQLLDCAMEQSFTAVMITTACLDFPGPEILYVNAAMTRMSGYPKEALLGATPRILQGPRTDRDMLHRLRVALAAGEPFEASTVNYRRDGTPYQVEWHISPVRDETGSLTHFISVQHDITRALEDEKQIQLLSSVLEVSSDGVIMTDAVGNIEYVNASFEDYTGNDRGNSTALSPSISTRRSGRCPATASSPVDEASGLAHALGVAFGNCLDEF